MAAQIAQRAAAVRPMSHRRASFRLWSIFSFVPILLALEQTGRSNKLTRYTGRGCHSGCAYSCSSVRLWGVYQVEMSRYQLREKPRQSQQSLKAASLHVPVRTVYLEIASGGNAQTQCLTQRRIRNALGPWMRVHLQGTVAVEIGLPFPLLFLRH